MSDTYKKVGIVGTSGESVSDAIQSAIRRTAETVHDLKWFEVDEIRGRIEGDKVVEYQVTLEIGFRITPDTA